MNSNQIVSGSTRKPMQVNASRDLTGDIYIARREFLGNVSASGTISTSSTSATSIQSTFSVSTYNINAGLAQSFPWLSQVARNFTFYDFEGLIFEYKPLSGEYGNLNTNALGKVVLATQYDPDAPNFNSSVQMENYDYATACKPSEHMLHGVETKRAQRSTNMLYVRTGSSSKDEVLTDLGDFQIATEGIPLIVPAGLLSISQAIGELWVTYKCKLSRANIYASVSSCPMDVHYALTSYGGGAAGSIAQGQYVSSAFTGTGAYLQSIKATSSTLYFYNTNNTSLNQFCPKLTNSLGTSVWGYSSSVFYIVFPPNTTGNYNLTITNCSTGSGVTCGVLPTAATTASDLNPLLTTGWPIPSGLVSQLSIGTAVIGTSAVQGTLLTGKPGGNLIGGNQFSGSGVGVSSYIISLSCSSSQIGVIKVTQTQTTAATLTAIDTLVMIQPSTQGFTN